MKQLFILFCIFVVALAGSLSVAVAGNVDKYIKDLKNADPKVRAEAAYELSCG
jgi:hypothetical protein